MSILPDFDPNFQPSTHGLPFGMYAGKTLDDVPASFPAWLLRAAKLSSGLRGAVTEELAWRGFSASPLRWWGCPPKAAPSSPRRSWVRR
jgi:uncharacterized protein (DUF3820 family)